MSVLALLLLACAAPVGQELAPARVESFVLFERGAVWSAERERLGTATASWSDSGAELLLYFEPNATRVQRVSRRREGETTFFWREWRVGVDQGAQAGRTLVLERGSRGGTLREWGGRAMRSQVAPDGTPSLVLVDRARRRRGFFAEVVLRFDPLEVRASPALVLQVPLAIGFAGAPRVLSIVPLDGGMRPSQWVFCGDELLAFAEGGIQAARQAPTAGPEVATLERLTDGL